MPKVLLTVELVPRTCWGSNVRSRVSKSDWDKIRRQVYKAAGYFCEVCGGKGSNRPVECHEIWSYLDTDLIQRLDGMTALCPSCHQAKHYGRSCAVGKKYEVEEHLKKVNNWSQTDLALYLEHEFEVWAKRSSKQWQLDLTILKNFSIIRYDSERTTK